MQYYDLLRMIQHTMNYQGLVGIDRYYYEVTTEILEKDCNSLCSNRIDDAALAFDALRDYGMCEDRIVQA